MAAALILLPAGHATAAPLPISHVVWTYNVNPNSLVVDEPGILFVRDGKFTSPRDFQVNFGFYNFTLDPISISKITFDFWENDGLIGDDKLVNDVVLTLPQPFVLQPTKVDFKLKFTFSLGGEVTDVDFDPKFKLPPPVKTPFYTFTVSDANLNKGTNASTDRRTVEFADATTILLRPLGSVTDIHVTAVAEPSTLLLVAGGLTGMLRLRRRRAGR